MPNVVLVTSLHTEAVHRLTAAAPADFEVQHLTHEASLADKTAAGRNADYLVLFPSRIEDEVLQAARHLKLIQLVSAGFDKLNLPLCRELGLPIANNGGANALDVAEHTIAMILAMYRRFRELDTNVRRNRWHAIDTGRSTYTLHGKTVGIVGLGNIGRQVARLLAAFGAQTLAFDAQLPDVTTLAALGVEAVSLPALLQRADIVTLHVPLNENTHHLIDAAALAQMKPGAVLVNTCRGPVVDEAALIAALQAQRLAGAALDVLAQEPPPSDHPLFAMDNVLLTPHSAGVTADTWTRRGEFVFANLQRVQAGEPPLARVA